MTEAVQLRHDWSRGEIEELLNLPLMDLLWRAQGCIDRSILAITFSWHHFSVSKQVVAKKTVPTALNRCITAVMSQVSLNCRLNLF